MKLLDPNIAAPDIRYNNIQKPIGCNNPPDLAIRHVKELYSLTSHILDSGFREKIKLNFAACYSEMYFAASLMERSKIDVTHPSDEGADFYLKNLDCWAEVVTATDGKEGNPNTIPQPKFNEVQSYPEEQLVLRLSSVFCDKAKKLKEEDIKKGRIDENQPIIICISGGWLTERLPMHPEGGYPVIAKTLLPIGDFVLWINTKTNTITSHEYKYREGMSKKTNAGQKMISTDFFLNAEFNHINAVVYSWANAANPIERSKWGCDFYTVHNPFAKNKLPLGFIRCGIEYPVTANEKSFTMDPPIDHERS
ncbi:MAG: hypothetical protein FJ264_11340 [Planctomycetes bacterium]|nr:hypothetical protein [Planctomycetota bacterium]